MSIPIKMGMLFYYIAKHNFGVRMFKKFLSLLVVATILALVCPLYAQKEKLNEFYLNFTKYYKSGDFINAEKCLLNILESKDSLPNDYLVAIYNNLGVLSNRLGKYDEALRNYNYAEILSVKQKQYFESLADIYINKARIYGILKESDKAIEYLEQGIKIYRSINNPNKSLLFSISTAYLNLGLTYFEKKDYTSALLYLEKSKDLKLKYNLSEVALAYMNIAKTYIKINDPDKAQQYFLKSIESFTKEFGKDYYRLVEVYFDYGLYLRSIGRNREALEVHQKALSICLKNYGEKHTFVSLAYKHLGDHFFLQGDYQTALAYYQKSLIAVVTHFNDTNIYSNPKLDSVLFDIRLLENLKSKTKALEQLSKQQENPVKKQEVLVKGFETIELTMQLIERIRSGFVSTESQIYLAENEKDTYIFATQIAEELYELTKNPEYLQRMYSITCNSKSAVLRNEISENELLKKNENTKSLSDNLNKLQLDIAAFSKLIQDELQKSKPDSVKIDFWKTTVFNLNRSKEKLSDSIKKVFPLYETLIKKTEPISLVEIQNHLKGDETLVEYFFSPHYNEGKRELFIFAISKSRLDCHFTYVDTLFLKQMELIKFSTTSNSIATYTNYTNALFAMYEGLIKPIEDQLVGKRIIVIPDEEIAYLPFDAFIREKPNSNQVEYDGLRYLIYDYIFSYGYTSSLIFPKSKASFSLPDLYAFSPYYGDPTNGSLKEYTSLKGAEVEINSIFKWFKGVVYSGARATESNFKRLIKKPAILHLAMHTQTDSANSKYSYLIFDNQSDAAEDGKLYNYEISLNRVESPMVVLSACNTASGNLYRGEGLMSLTRGFILAGASSVVSTFWDVNDDASAKIMGDFYYHLSKGEYKDNALRMAKLNYLETTPPSYTKPSYWAAYEVFGDNSPVERNRSYYLILLGIVIILIGIVFVVYSKRLRRSFAKFW